jgi:hypothetical protein
MWPGERFGDIGSFRTWSDPLAGRAPAETPSPLGTVTTVAIPRAELDRVIGPRRAVALAQHYRYAEGLSIAQIADRLGRSPPVGDDAA